MFAFNNPKDKFQFTTFEKTTNFFNDLNPNNMMELNICNHLNLEEYDKKIDRVLAI